jgi:hypothetical protein
MDLPWRHGRGRDAEEGGSREKRERRENEWLRRLVASVISLPSGHPVLKHYRNNYLDLDVNKSGFVHTLPCGWLRPGWLTIKRIFHISNNPVKKIMDGVDSIIIAAVRGLRLPRPTAQRGRRIRTLAAWF